MSKFTVNKSSWTQLTGNENIALKLSFEIEDETNRKNLQGNTLLFVKSDSQPTDENVLPEEQIFYDNNTKPIIFGGGQSYYLKLKSDSLDDSAELFFKDTATFSGGGTGASGSVSSKKFFNLTSINEIPSGISRIIISGLLDINLATDEYLGLVLFSNGTPLYDNTQLDNTEKANHYLNAVFHVPLPESSDTTGFFRTRVDDSFTGFPFLFCGKDINSTTDDLIFESADICLSSQGYFIKADCKYKDDINKSLNRNVCFDQDSLMYVNNNIANNPISTSVIDQIRFYKLNTNNGTLLPLTTNDYNNEEDNVTIEFIKSRV